MQIAITTPALNGASQQGDLEPHVGWKNFQMVYTWDFAVLALTPKTNVIM